MPFLHLGICPVKKRELCGSEKQFGCQHLEMAVPFSLCTFVSFFVCVFIYPYIHVFLEEVLALVGCQDRNWSLGVELVRF